MNKRDFLAQGSAAVVAGTVWTAEATPLPTALPRARPSTRPDLADAAGARAWRPYVGDRFQLDTDEIVVLREVRTAAPDAADARTEAFTLVFEHAGAARPAQQLTDLRHLASGQQVLLSLQPGLPGQSTAVCCHLR